LERRPGLLSTLASLASLFAALSCCLPLGTLLLAAGSATASALSEKLRSWLLALSVACLVFAFAQTYYLRRCDFRQRRLRTALLWFSALMVSGMLVFPRFTSTLMAGRLPSFLVAGAFRDFNEQTFISEFNAAADHQRIVLLLSPT
jgi:hypothetical protein